jgi:hypothetical protein
MVVSEQPRCLPERHPAGVVDLVGGPEGAGGRGHLPVADGFGSSLGITVGGGPDLTPRRQRSPVSSWTSRRAAWASVSPGWSLPLGNDQSS